MVLTGKGKALCAINNGVYASSFDGQNGILNITLLRSPSYCAHPIFDGKVHRKVMPQDRYTPYIEQGERDFSFMFEIGEEKEILTAAPRKAQLFGMQPMVYSFYPTGVGEKNEFPFTIDGNIIQMTALKKAECGDGYIIRLFNPTGENQSCNLSFMGNKMNLSFGKYEIKTIRVDSDTLCETDLLEGLLER